jgi:hypothetical protein
VKTNDFCSLNYVFVKIRSIFRIIMYILWGLCRNAISVEKKYSIAYEKDWNRKNENNNNDFIKCLQREDKGFIVSW